jgi:hypothetical protein
MSATDDEFAAGEAPPPPSDGDGDLGSDDEVCLDEGSADEELPSSQGQDVCAFFDSTTDARKFSKVSPAKVLECADLESRIAAKLRSIVSPVVIKDSVKAELATFSVEEDEEGDGDERAFAVLVRTAATATKGSHKYAVIPSRDSRRAKRLRSTNAKKLVRGVAKTVENKISYQLKQRSNSAGRIAKNLVEAGMKRVAVQRLFEQGRFPGAEEDAAADSEPQVLPASSTCSLVDAEAYFDSLPEPERFKAFVQVAAVCSQQQVYGEMLADLYPSAVEEPVATQVVETHLWPLLLQRSSIAVLAEHFDGPPNRKLLVPGGSKQATQKCLACGREDSNAEIARLTRANLDLQIQIAQVKSQLDVEKLLNQRQAV